MKRKSRMMNPRAKLADIEETRKNYLRLFAYAMIALNVIVFIAVIYALIKFYGG